MSLAHGISWSALLYSGTAWLYRKVMLRPSDTQSGPSSLTLYSETKVI
jgi:hypothetical protein